MKIGVFQNRPGIGDMCVFLPYIHKIAIHYNSKIILFTKRRSKAKEFLYQDPYIKKIIYIDDIKKKYGFKIFKLIYIFKFDKVFIFHFGIKFYVQCILAKIKSINFYGFFKRNVSITGYLNSKVKKWLKIKNLNYQCKIYLSNTNIKLNNYNVIIGIGGSGSNKKWPIASYINLIKLIHNKNNKLNFVIAGGLEEKKDFEMIKKNLPNIQLKSLINLSIKESLNHIVGSKFYVGNDTGFMHLCGMLNITSFGLFGDTPTDYINYNPHLVAIIPENYKTISQNSSAMSKIKYDYVFKKIKKIIN